MSGTGTSDFGAPAQLSTISGDQPMGSTVDGNPVMPSFYLLQFLQRILSYIGQPADNSGTTLTVVAQEALATAEEAISMVTNIQLLTLSIQSQLANSAANAALIPAAPAVCCPPLILPAAPRTGLTQAQVLALQTFAGGAF